MARHFIIIFLTLWAVQSTAKDMSSRLGFGYSDQFSVKDLHSFNVRYYGNSNYGVSMAVAIDTQDRNNKYGGLLKLYKIVFPEEYLNFYIGGGLGFLSNEVNGSEDSGVEISGFVGAEFFIPKLENLGFSFEAGVGISTLDETRVRTIGDHPLRAGITFYL